MQTLSITSPAFKNGEMIPRKYTCKGIDVNPALEISGVPPEAKSLALIMDDPDAPAGTWVHWVVWNISPAGRVEENSIPGVEGMNSSGGHHYHGPCPPSGAHRYFFKFYALNAKLDIPKNTSKKELEMAILGHLIAKGELMGPFKKD